ncbi:MAG: hypothetical protein HUJ86_00140, partial [Synergistes sp.]|nr:hypothetical protein [Synergistes sp.]
DGSANENKVNISDGQIGQTHDNALTQMTVGGLTFKNGSVYGGMSKNADATSNDVTISGGTVYGSVYGGYSQNGSASNNDVTIEGGTIKGSVYGAYTAEGSDTDGSNNTITLKGGTIEGNVIGAFVHNGKAFNNVINWYDGTISGGLFAEDTDYSLSFSGNTLNMYAKEKEVGYLGGFEFYNFYLPDDFDLNTDTMLKVAGGKDYKLRLGNSAYFTVNGLNNGKATLISVQEGTIEKDGFSYLDRSEFREDLLPETSGNYILGISSVSIDVVENNKKVVAEVTLPEKDEEIISTTSKTLTLGADDTYFAAAGGIAVSADANDNKITITGGKIGNDDEQPNYQYFRDGDLFNLPDEDVDVTFDNGDVYGGYVGMGDYTKQSVGSASSNEVTISGNSEIKGSVFGGKTNSGSADYNVVKITGGSVDGDVYGGDARKSGSNNSVSITNASIGESVYGGYGSGSASNNTVNITGASIDGSVYGGEAGKGASSKNIVTITDSTVKEVITGGYSDYSNVTSNEVKISGGNITYVVGGNAEWGNVIGNSVEISNDANIVQVYGGITYYDDDRPSGNVINNTVTINSGTIGEAVYGGFAYAGSVENNIVNWKGGNITGGLYGGFVQSSDIYSTISGNTLNMFVANKTVTSLDGFQKYNFYLSNDFNLINDSAITVGKSFNTKDGTNAALALGSNISLSYKDAIRLIVNNGGTIDESKITYDASGMKAEAGYTILSGDKFKGSVSGDNT